MTEEEHQHMRCNIAEFSDQMRKKYIRGQKQHGGGRWVRPQTGYIIEEGVDLAHYVMTKRQQELVLRTLVEAALKTDDVECKDAALNRVLELYD